LAQWLSESGEERGAFHEFAEPPTTYCLASEQQIKRHVESITKNGDALFGKHTAMFIEYGKVEV